MQSNLPMWSTLLSSHLYFITFFLSCHRKFHMNLTSFQRSPVLKDHFYFVEGDTKKTKKNQSRVLNSKRLGVSNDDESDEDRQGEEKRNKRRKLNLQEDDKKVSNLCIHPEAVVILIVWQLDLQLPMQSVPIESPSGEVYSIQHYVILSVTCGMSVVFSGYSGFLHQ